MDRQTQKRISKFLSLVLRHKPQEVGIVLSADGWVNVDTLIDAINLGDKRLQLDRADLDFVVENNDKKRFEYSSDASQIRASQGHSIEVDLGYQAKSPPAQLFHGTPEKFVNSILKQGLTKQGRNHVHLSVDIETATVVAQRRGKAVIFLVDADAMSHAGHQFFISTNGVWLTNHVPREFLKIPSAQ